VDGRPNQKNKALLSNSSGVSVNGALVSENSLFVLFFFTPNGVKNNYEPFK